MQLTVSAVLAIFVRRIVRQIGRMCVFVCMFVYNTRGWRNQWMLRKDVPDWLLNSTGKSGWEKRKMPAGRLQERGSRCKRTCCRSFTQASHSEGSKQSCSSRVTRVRDSSTSRPWANSAESGNGVKRLLVRAEAEGLGVCRYRNHIIGRSSNPGRAVTRYSWRLPV